jgi:methyl-accepting chemotaxis protein
VNRLSVQALGGRGTVLTGGAFLLLAILAMGAIASFLDLSNRNNASALVHERAETQLHVLLRGLSETAATGGSMASIDMVNGAVAGFETVRPAVEAQEGSGDLAAWGPLKAQVEDLMRDRRNKSLDDDALIALGRVSTGLDKLAADMTVRSRARREAAGRAERHALAVVAVSSLLVLAGILGLFVAFHRGVTQPVETAIGLADRIAGGDLTAQFERRDGQAGRLLAALGDMNGDLRRIVTGVRETNHGIQRAAGELAQGSRDLSDRTERQASAIEETAASLQQLDTVVGTNATGARTASEKSRHARESAVRGEQVVGQFLQRMEAIERSSLRIAETIRVIDEIAFQTNILALNAAVEAARAGNEGRGFAVVAAEVRALAQRSATAAGEIKGLIAESTAQVREGGRMIEGGNLAMREIVAAIEEVTGAVERISVASGEQAAGIRQVNEALTQIEQTVQQNAALVEEFAQSAQALHGQAEELGQVVRVFTLEGDGSRAHAGASAEGAVPEGCRLEPPER